MDLGIGTVQYPWTGGWLENNMILSKDKKEASTLAGKWD